MMYKKINYTNGIWIITDESVNVQSPKKACTFAFDTETFVYLDGKICTQNELFNALNGLSQEEKRARLSTNVWCWQIYDEKNGFFMTNDFDQFLLYQCRCGYKFGWCYNAKFDFSQIDYRILGNPNHSWKQHVSKDGKAYNKAQQWAYESIHNDMGSRYAYKLWIPYRNKNRHKYVHSVEYRDFMNIFAGGLKRCLESLNVVDKNGNPIRKLEMDYQGVDVNNLSEAEIDYCKNDVMGLYYAIKIYNESVEEQSNGERHIFGKDTNVCTAGGFAKSELLRTMYPNQPAKKRIKYYQSAHPITEQQDIYFRDNHLYRGGICYVNPYYRGRLLESSKIGTKMRRYDVNSEYPYAMSVMRDLIGEPFIEDYAKWCKRTDKEDYECILILTSVFGKVKDGYMGLWYNPVVKDYVDVVDEDFTHLMFEREFDEFIKWYDLEYTCEKVILYKRGGLNYKPFVDKYYALKAQAKKDKNAGLQAVSKLMLNSSYGKLSERIRRIKGQYELNEENGTIHFVKDGVDIDTKSIMNVAIGALVTSIARVWIMSHIRTICKGEKMRELFVYIDTDSIHCFCDYEKADAFTLGGFKLEAECEAVKYIAPKTYFDVEKVNENGKIDINDVEIHTKGINVKAVKEDAQRENLTLEYLDNKFNYGSKYVVLCAMNVVGGKALVPTEKILARLEQDTGIYTVLSNYNGSGILSEV